MGQRHGGRCSLLSVAPWEPGPAHTSYLICHDGMWGTDRESVYSHSMSAGGGGDPHDVFEHDGARKTSANICQAPAMCQVCTGQCKHSPVTPHLAWTSTPKSTAQGTLMHLTAYRLASKVCPSIWSHGLPSKTPSGFPLISWVISLLSALPVHLPSTATKERSVLTGSILCPPSRTPNASPAHDHALLYTGNSQIFISPDLSFDSRPWCSHSACPGQKS